MKTDKQLVILMIEQFENCLLSGLCACAFTLFQDHVIDFEEFLKLKRIIFFLRPEQIYGKSNFYWEPFDTSVRIQKLQELQFDTNGKFLPSKEGF